VSASLEELGARLRSGSLSSARLVERCLETADRLDPRIGTYRARFDEAARKAAADRDAELAAGRDRGPLHGIPLGIKDILAAREGPTTAQSLVLDPAWGAGRDALAVERLRRAGAVILGKTTTMEFAIGAPDPAKPFPLPRNPWELARSPGGSSAGTGNGIAAGLFPAGLGTDTGGSIRIPAAFCGVTGHKPTYGLVPRTGCVPLGFTYDSIGPLARSARDCALLLAALAGADASDPACAAQPPLDLSRLDAGVHGLTIGVGRRAASADACEPAIAGLFDAALGALERLGARLVEIDLPDWEVLREAALLGTLAEAFAWHRGSLASRWSDYGRPTRIFLADGALLSGADYVQAQRVRRRAREKYGELLRRVDLIATPTMGGLPWLLDAPFDAAGIRRLHTPQANALGFPALALPIGFVSGLPASLQLMAAPFADALALRAGAAYQSATHWHREIPTP
jgi:aspartyl-tRNA(Asn)/glutamyl-tRNA(Gln) amidotransferase subunit A